MSLSDVDRILLQRCLDRDPRAWRDFVDRFIGLVVHVVNNSATGRGLSLDDATRDDLVSEVFLVLLRHDLAVLRRFQRQSSLATYLTVIARRVVIRKLTQWKRQSGQPKGGHSGRSDQAASKPVKESSPAQTAATNGVSTNGHATAVDPQTVADETAGGAIERMENADQIERLMMRLDAREASVVRMYHLEGKTYQQISRVIGLAENSIGPMLHRARAKMRD
ncbi:MAG: sigma-70 family RNA polymerase sigma factor [Planctomycetota bacterium]